MAGYFDHRIYSYYAGVTRGVHADTSDDTFTIYTEQDLTDIIDENKVLREQQTGKEQFRLAARVPVHVAEQAMREGWFHDDKAWAKWLNDTENKDHRVWEGRI